MQTRQIPTSEWPVFFENFGRRHEGWLVKLEILNPDFGAQVEGTALILEGLIDEWNERTGNTIMIMACNTPEDHLTHVIHHPTEVSVERTDAGIDAALSIKSADGTTALLSFGSGFLPETFAAL